jgi:hypothetical protein
VSIIFFFVYVFSYDERLVDTGIDGRIILRFMLCKLEFWGMDWIPLAKGSDRWRALVNVVMNFCVL